MSTWYADLLLLAAIVIPPLLMVLAIFVDLRSRRGFGLILLALAMMGYCLWRVVSTEQALVRATASEESLLEIALLFDFLVFGYLTLLVWIGMAVEVSIAGQKGWLVALVVEGVLGVLVLLATVVLQVGGSLFTVAGGGAAVLALLAPMATALVYGVVRSARPAPRPAPAPGELIPAPAGEVPQESTGMRPQPQQSQARYQGSVIAVGILSAIMFLSVSLVLFLAFRGFIRTPLVNFPAGESQDVIGFTNLGYMLFSIFLGLPASVIAIVVGHVALVILRRIPKRPVGTAPGRTVLTVLLTVSLVTAYLAMAMQIYYWVIFNLTNGFG